MLAVVVVVASALALKLLMLAKLPQGSQQRYGAASSQVLRIVVDINEFAAIYLVSLSVTLSPIFNNKLICSQHLVLLLHNIIIISCWLEGWLFGCYLYRMGSAEGESVGRLLNYMNDRH